MNEHRDGKIAFLKHARDHCQMTTNSILGSGIRGLVALDLDGTPVRQKAEVVSCFLVVESHSLIAASVHAPEMAILSLRSLLGIRGHIDQTEQKKEEEAIERRS